MFAALTTLCAITAASAVAGLLVERRTRSWLGHYRFLALLSGIGLPFVLLLCLFRVMDVANFPWNQARLAPLFGLRYGYSLYYLPQQGPVTGTLLGPLAYLAYFPSLIAHMPLPALLIGSGTASFYFFAPVVWIFLSGSFHRHEGRAVGVFLLVIFILGTIGSAPLDYSAFAIHADAPALGLAACACAILVCGNSASGRYSVLRLVLSSFFAVLALYTKQSTVFVVPAIACFLWTVDGLRPAVQFIVSSAVVFLITSTVFSWMFGAQALLFGLYSYPSHHGFGTGYMQFPHRTIGSALRAIFQASYALWGYSEVLLILIALCYILGFHVRPDRISVRGWLQENRWSIFHFVAVAGLPASALFAAKVGGDTNHFSLFVYFGFIGLLLAGGRLILQQNGVVKAVIAAAVTVLAVLIPSAVVNAHAATVTRLFGASDTEKVYEYDKRHPGEIYFSFFPLPVLMAEGRLYHFEYALFDRELGGARVGNEHFFHYIPPKMEYVERNHASSPITEYLPDFSCPVQILGLEDLDIYEKCTNRCALN